MYHKKRTTYDQRSGALRLVNKQYDNFYNPYCVNDQRYGD
jgi:hypothetical protein